MPPLDRFGSDADKPDIQSGTSPRMRDGQTRLGDGEAITEYRKEANPSRAYSLEASVIAQRNVNFHCPEARLVSDIRALFANVPPKQPASAFVAEHSDLIQQRIKQPEI